MSDSETASVYERSGGAARADEAPSTIEQAVGAAPEVRQEALLDEAVQETFPASDPVAVVRIL